ncbi:MAG: acyloxyacyl hydrolase [Xanthomonadales bacterium]|nr:acyloxyacyl hydrolase [Xanthomonadales bacterium]
MKRLLTLLTLSLLACCTGAAADERERSLTLDVGRSSSDSGRGHAELDIYRVGHRWGFKKTLWQGDSSRIGGYYEASLNRWNGPLDDITAVAFSPVFVWSFGESAGRAQPYIEAGIGVAFLDDKSVGGRQLGSSWQFEDRIGFGLKFERWDIHYRYMHYSNADLEKPNQGIDAHVIGISYAY